MSFHGIFACRAIASFLGAISGSFLVFFSLFLVFELVLATGSSGTRKKSRLNTVQFSSSTKVDRKGCEDENPYSFFHKIHPSIYYKQKRSLRSNTQLMQLCKESLKKFRLAGIPTLISVIPLPHSNQLRWQANGKLDMKFNFFQSFFSAFSLSPVHPTVSINEIHLHFTDHWLQYVTNYLVLRLGGHQPQPFWIS